MFLTLFKVARTVIMTALQKPDVIFVLGAPGSGKGTQCSNIVKEFGFIHLSAGDLLREERKKTGSKYGELIEEHIRNGQIVPVEITCHLLEMAMNNHISKKFLIDGFPRNQDNLDGWNRQMSDKANAKFVLFFESSKEVCIQRCLSRGAAGSGRSDDNAASLEKRFITYLNETMPVIKQFEEQHLVCRINAERPVHEVFEEVKDVFKKYYPTK